MKIGLVIPSLPAYSETFFNSKIRGLIESGFDLILFTNSASGENKLAVHKSLRKPSGILKKVFLGMVHAFAFIVFSPRRAFRFLRLEMQSGRSFWKTLKGMYLNLPILRSNLDWLHFGFSTMALGRENIAKTIGAKSATSFRGFDLSIYPLKHEGAYDLLWKRLDKVHTISDDLLDHAFALGMPSSIPVRKITPAIDINRFNMDLSELQLRSPVNICTVARLHWKKGLEDTLQSLAILKEMGIPFKYTIVGDGEEYERLVFACYQLGIHDDVHFTGKVSHEEVLQILSRSDIYLQFSISEGFCNAVLEAQCAGLLCVVSDAEGLSENVLHGISGWVVNRFDVKGLARTIASIVEMPQQELNKIRRQARQRVRDKFSLETQKEKFRTFYLNN